MHPALTEPRHWWWWTLFLRLRAWEAPQLQGLCFRGSGREAARISWVSFTASRSLSSCHFLSTLGRSRVCFLFLSQSQPLPSKAASLQKSGREGWGQLFTPHTPCRPGRPLAQPSALCPTPSPSNKKGKMQPKFKETRFLCHRAEN